MENKTFGKVLKQLREEMELSQEQFGFRAGLHRTYVSQLERGIKSPSLQTLHKISRALRIKTSELIARIEDT